MKSVQRGFSLIELMIVVAIIAILAAVAIPNYRAQMRESQRTDAHAALLRMADAQEKYYLQNNTYATAAADVGGTGTENNLYTLAVTAADASTFSLTASVVAGGGQADDTACATITLTSAGVKGPSADCW